MVYPPDIRYTLNSNRPTMLLNKGKHPFTVKAGAKVKAAVFVHGKLMEEPAVKVVK